MPKPLATTKQSVPDHSALIELFQRLGQSSLDKAIAAQVDCEFYKALLKRVKADEPVAEFKGIPKAKVTKTLEGLITKTERAQLEAWNHVGLVDEHAAKVLWVEAFSQALQLHQTPLSIAPIFSKQREGPPRAWIFTSATLAVKNDFSHYTDQLGLSDEPAKSWPSPFDYANQALLYVPSHLPPPNSPGYTDAVVDAA